MVAYDITATLITYQPTAEKRVVRVLCGGDGPGEFFIKINGTLWGTLRNAWNQRSVILEMDSKSLGTSDTITVEAKNVAVEGSGSCTYEAYVYLGDAP